MILLGKFYIVTLSHHGYRTETNVTQYVQADTQQSEVFQPEQRMEVVEQQQQQQQQLVQEQREENIKQERNELPEHQSVKFNGKGTRFLIPSHFNHTHKTKALVNGLKAKLAELLDSNLAAFNSCLLLDLPGHENKGDPAITVGELNTLSDINMPIKYFSTEYSGKDQYEPVKAHLDPMETVVLAQGGGNIGAWAVCDNYRSKALQVFTEFKYFILSQSVYFFDQRHLAKTKEQYRTHGHVSILLRDQHSFDYTQKNLDPVTPILAPDMAFGMGAVFKYFPPALDVIWINRGDKERSMVSKPKFPGHVKYIVADWLRFGSPSGDCRIDNSYMKTHNGFLFLQRAKVVVTDRLHGYILATLLDIPTVMIDNKLKKLTNLRNTWTAGKDNAVVATNTEDAVKKALALLEATTTRAAPGF